MFNSIVICAQRNTLVQTCPDQELTSETYPKMDTADRDSHEKIVITETGIKNYIALARLGYHCLGNIMILDENNIEIEMMTIPFSMLIL